MRIICLHQSAELYGSDRSFLQVVKYFKISGRYSKITVVLPSDGPLVNELRDLDVDIKFLNLSLLSKTYLKKFQWGKIIRPLMSVASKRKFILTYDVLYVNTSVILDFYILAPFLKIKKVLHVREIPASWLSKVLSPLIRWSNSLVIFNSYSTQRSFRGVKNSLVIHNAFEGFENHNKVNLPKNTADCLNILLIGRINSWKGQDFAIDSLSKVGSRNFHLKIVGSTSLGNEGQLSHLKEKVTDLGMEGLITFIPFSDDASSFYSWADVVIVPSKKPEPFGRIAIEAMSLGKPVIAANHGGLPEIIQQGFSGFLFEPNSEGSFIHYIESYFNDRKLLEQHGKQALAVYERKFSIQNMYIELDRVFNT